MSWTCALRPEVSVSREGDHAVVSDPVTARRLDLGPIFPVLDRLDGRPADAIIGELGPGADPVLRTLALLLLLDGPGAAHVARLRDLRAGRAPLPLRTLPEQRFSCQGSGGCCRSFVFGPLTDADVARVAALDLTPWGLGPRFWEDHPRPDGRVDRFLRTTPDGRCLFLGEGERCGLHATYGATQKPGFCQLFPLSFHPTVAGLKVYDGGECASFPASARLGPPIAEIFAEQQDLLPAHLPLQHPVVHAGLPVDTSWFLALQDTWVAGVEEAAPADTLRALGARFARWSAALRAFPLVDGEPEGTLAAALSEPVAPWTPDDAGLPRLRALAAELRDLFAAVDQSPNPPPFGKPLVAALRRLADGDPLPPPDADEPARMRLSLRGSLFGHRALVEGRPGAALLRLALSWLVARHVAAEHGPALGHMVAARRLGMPWAPMQRVFVRADTDTKVILLAL